MTTTDELLKITLHPRTGFHEAYLYSLLRSVENSTASSIKLLYIKKIEKANVEIMFYVSYVSSTDRKDPEMMIRTRWSDFGGYPHLTSYKIGMQKAGKSVFYSNSEFQTTPDPNWLKRDCCAATIQYVYELYHIPTLKRVEEILLKFIAFSQIFERPRRFHLN